MVHTPPWLFGHFGHCHSARVRLGPSSADEGARREVARAGCFDPATGQEGSAPAPRLRPACAPARPYDKGAEKADGAEGDADGAAQRLAARVSEGASLSQARIPTGYSTSDAGMVCSEMCEPTWTSRMPEDGLLSVRLQGEEDAGCQLFKGFQVGGGPPGGVEGMLTACSSDSAAKRAEGRPGSELSTAGYIPKAEKAQGSARGQDRQPFVPIAPPVLALGLACRAGRASQPRLAS